MHHMPVACMLRRYASKSASPGRVEGSELQVQVAASCQVYMAVAPAAFSTFAASSIPCSRRQTKAMFQPSLADNYQRALIITSKACKHTAIYTGRGAALNDHTMLLPESLFPP